MSIGKTFYIFDEDGNPVTLGPGTYFCYDCKKKRKVIYYPFTDTIDEPCKCGSRTVFLMGG